MTITVKAPPPVRKPIETAGVPAPADSGNKLFYMAVGSVILLLAAVGIGWSLRRKSDRTGAGTGESVPGVSAEVEVDEDEDGDETMFMPDLEAASPAAAATLTVVESASLTPGQSFSISGNTRIGRNAKNDVDIPDKSVSRKHAEIYYENNAYHIRDLGSQNGLKVNDTRVSLTGMPLTSGAIIRFGPKTVLEFRWRVGSGDETDITPDDATKIY